MYEKNHFFYGKEKLIKRRITYKRLNEKLIKKKINLCCFVKILSNLTFMQGRKKIIMLSSNNNQRNVRNYQI